MQKKWSFQKGFDQVPKGMLNQVKTELMAVFNITTRAAWYRRLYGRIIPRADQVQAVEAVFKKYSITKNIWGE
jgi:hypothetical protein